MMIELKCNFLCNKDETWDIYICGHGSQRLDLGMGNEATDGEIGKAVAASLGYELVDIKVEYLTGDFVLVLENEHGSLMDAETHSLIRAATAEERATSDKAPSCDGVFPCDWREHGGWLGESYRLCYVESEEQE